MSNDVSLDINQESNPVQAVAPPKEDNNMLRATDKITALYCRLFVEDTKEKGGKDDPSNSIQHQDGICQGDFLPKLSFYVKASFAIVILAKDVFSIFNMMVVKSFLRMSIGFQYRHNNSAMNNKRYARIIRDTFHNIFKSRTASRFEITHAFTLWNRIKAH